MNQPSDYSFVVMGNDAEWYPLDFRPMDDAAQKYLVGVWRRMAEALDTAHSLHNSPTPEWVKWKPWDWCSAAKPDYQPRKPWMAWCGSRLAGFLNVWEDFPSQHEPGQKTLYLEHIGAFPGDQSTELWQRRYRHVGKTLFAFAVNLSKKSGYGGRVGLHAANDVALQFYRTMAQNRDPALFKDEKTGIFGPTPHANRGDAGRTYLETNSDGAINYLEDYRNV